MGAFDVGLGLGSQVCQISAVMFANKIDHYFKDQCGIKQYQRYMDDGYILSNSLNDVKKYIEALYALCKELKLNVNEHKIKIIKLSNGFTFLKKRIRLTDSGRIILRLKAKTLKAVRKRLKKMYGYYIEGKISYKDVEQCYKSWRYSVVKKYKNFKAIARIDGLYDELFIIPFLKGGYL